MIQSVVVVTGMSKPGPMAGGPVICTKLGADATLSGGPVMDGSGRHGCGEGSGGVERERGGVQAKKKPLRFLYRQGLKDAVKGLTES
jgi:hypothetical protein